MVWISTIAGVGTALGLFHLFRPRSRHAVSIQLGACRPKQPGEPLRLITLNLAHGRGDRMLQTVSLRRHAEQRLGEVAALLGRQAPDVVALQEADDRAFWSGRFNHAEYLGRALGMASLVHVRHVSRPGLGYGTALLTKLPVEDSSWGHFPPSPTTFSKGWSCLSMVYPDGRGGRVDIISVHLDFLQRRRREMQARELVNALVGSPHSMVLMGDFNCDLGGRERTLRILCEGLGLEVCDPGAMDIVTYPRTRRRLDWILVSRDLSFREHRVLPENISDHRAVLAVVGARGRAG